jgi:hypothetical protein
MKRKCDKAAAEAAEKQKKVVFGSAATNLSAALGAGLFDDMTEVITDSKKPSGTYGVLVQYPSKIVASGAGSCLVSIEIVDLGQKNQPVWFMKTEAAFKALCHMAKKISAKKAGTRLVYEALGKVFVAPTRRSPYGEENEQKFTTNKKSPGQKFKCFHLATYIAVDQDEEGMNARVLELAESIAVLIRTQKVAGGTDINNNVFISLFNQMASERVIATVSQTAMNWTRVQNMDAGIGQFDTLDSMFMDQEINDGLMTMFDCPLDIDEFPKLVMGVGWKVKIEH